MAEQLDLTTAVPASGGTTFWRINQLRFLVDDDILLIHLIGQNNEKKQHTYTGTTAHDIMVAINKADLTTDSLQKRLLERLDADGVISGTVSGTPE
jgi:hypothetical protein